MTVVPVLPAPDLTYLKSLLEVNGIDAWVGGWTNYSFPAERQVDAGAYVMVYRSSVRDEAVDALVFEGYTCHVLADGTIQVDFPAEDW